MALIVLNIPLPLTRTKKEKNLFESFKLKTDTVLDFATVVRRRDLTPLAFIFWKKREGYLLQTYLR